MNKRGIYVKLLLALLSLVQSSVSQPQQEASISNTGTSNHLPYDERVSDLIADKVLNVGRVLGQELMRENPSTKIQVFSPLSITSVLALLMLGARGESYQQLQQLFEPRNDRKLFNDPRKFYTEFGNLLDDLQRRNESHGFTRQRKNSNWHSSYYPEDFEQSDVTTKIANGLFPQVGLRLNPDYLYTLQSIFSATMQPLNFATQPEKARGFINGWVRNQTNGKIPELLPELSSDNKLIIANTLYFKGAWLNAFNESSTGKFYPQGILQHPVEKAMMKSGGYFPFHKSVAYDCSIIGLPYKDIGTTMYVIVPKNSTPSKLRELQGNLTSTIIEELISQMEVSSYDVEFPKMSLTGSLYLRPILSRLGVQDIFIKGISDLSLLESDSTCDIAPLELSRDVHNRISLGYLEQDRVKTSYRKSNLFVDDIIHKVEVDIDEKGTEGAAATATSEFRLLSDPFIVNTPFMFLIRDDLTKLTLFYGLVNEP